MEEKKCKILALILRHVPETVDSKPNTTDVFGSPDPVVGASEVPLVVDIVTTITLGKLGSIAGVK